MTPVALCALTSPPGVSPGFRDASGSLQPAPSDSRGVRRRRADEFDAVHLPHDSDHGRHRRRNVGRRRGGPAALATSPPHSPLRARSGAGLFRVGSFCRTVGNALRRSEYESVVVLRDGEPVAAGSPVDAGRFSGAAARVGGAAGEHGGDSGTGVRGVYYGSGVRRGGGVFRARDGRCPYMGIDNEKCDAGISLSVRLLARYVYAVGSRWSVVGRGRSAAEGGKVDGVGEAVLRVRYDRRSAVLSHQNGAAASMRLAKHLVLDSLLATALVFAAPQVVPAQDLGI